MVTAWTEWDSVLKSPGAPSAKEASLISAFSAAFKGVSPTFIVHVPGLCNIIGTHIDHQGFSMLPFAIPQDVSIAVALSPSGEDQSITIKNVDPAYPTTVLDVSALISSEECPSWASYLRAGFLGVKDLCAQKAEKGVRWKGMSLLVEGSIPTTCGLGNSSALCVAAGLTCLYANNLVRLVPCVEQFASSMAVAEMHFCGCRGNGMAETTQLAAQIGMAKHYDCTPKFGSQDISLPATAVFAVVNSMSTVPKEREKLLQMRTVECTLAAAVLAKRLGITAWESVSTLGQIPQLAHLSLKQMAPACKLHLPPKRVSLADIATYLELDEKAVEEKYFRVPVDQSSGFSLLSRALHVFAEAQRVDQFVDACNHQSFHSLLRLGQLMNESHTSCRDLYQSSTPELDELVEAATGVPGVVGACLTGKGWGGCLLALCDGQAAAEHLHYDVKRVMENRHLPYTSETMFVTKPCSGATISLLS